MKPWLAFAMIAAVAAPLLGICPARAEPPQSVTLDTSRLQGFFAGAEVGTGIFGYEASGLLGAQAQEIRILGDRRYVLQWNGAAQGVAGVVASANPYYPILGVRAQAGGELGIRLVPSWTVSPYLGVALAGTAQAVAVVGVSPSALNTINNTDGIAGLGCSAGARFNAGGSVLGSSHLEAVFFIQEEVLCRQTNTPAKAFTDIGLHLKYDLKNSMAIGTDIWVGETGQSRDSALETTSQTTRWGIALNVVKTLGPHWLIGGGPSLEREGTTESVAGSALPPFVTAGPLTAIFNVQVGVQ